MRSWRRRQDDPRAVIINWNTERPQYIGMVDEDRLREWEPLWNRLAERINPEHAAPQN
jgi:hypothetical protein